MNEEVREGMREAAKIVRAWEAKYNAWCKQAKATDAEKNDWGYASAVLDSVASDIESRVA